MNEIVFRNDGTDFSALHAAERWLKARGYSVGSLQRGDPVGVMKGDFCIAKWRNLDRADKAGLDGHIEWRGGSARNGDAVLLLKEATP